MRLSVVAIGRLKAGPERELVERYRQRIDAIGRSLGVSGLDLVELPESRARREEDRRVEGLPACDWVLIDAGDVIVHVFRPEVRSFYNLEKMWGADRPHERMAG